MVRLALPIDGRHGALDQIGRSFDTDRLKFLEREKRGGSREAGSNSRRLLRPHGKIVIAPPAIDRFVTLQAIDLSADDVADSLLPLRVGSALVHVHERLDG